ncbi:hypothetical protein N7468_004009 [Penicillium chermesinum]|uniref:Uncharacterized protein n=1 Tax=Penicillium chermesinum TaxID=63820 RepID=A0A9W9P7P5_9EURO|nr:uncharacterized protein N7468_004009 [Penicillium chermesinum]KAJ5239390.1 hypothetical protein N7468_004009 [Penicillium chermesinum]
MCHFPTNLSAATKVWLLIFPEKTEPSELKKLYEPLRVKLAKVPGLKSQKESIPFLTPVGFPFGFTRVLQEPRSLQRWPQASHTGWKKIKWGRSDTITRHVVAGGTVAANGDKIDSVVSPAWRKMVSHLGFTNSWAQVRLSPNNAPSLGPWQRCKSQSCAL